MNIATVLNDLEENEENIIKAISYYLGNEMVRKPLYRVGKCITSDMIYFNLIKALYSTKQCNCENNPMFDTILADLWNTQISCSSINKIISKENSYMKKLKIKIYTKEERRDLLKYVCLSIDEIISNKQKFITNSYNDDIYFLIFKNALKMGYS